MFSDVRRTRFLNGWLKLNRFRTIGSDSNSHPRITMFFGNLNGPEYEERYDYMAFAVQDNFLTYRLGWRSLSLLLLSVWRTFMTPFRSICWRVCTCRPFASTTCWTTEKGMLPWGFYMCSVTSPSQPSFSNSRHASRLWLSRILQVMWHQDGRRRSSNLRFGFLTGGFKVWFLRESFASVSYHSHMTSFSCY